MPNRPEYMAIWLGITSVGGVVALLNTNLTGASLAHSVNLVSPRHIIADGDLVERLGAVWQSLERAPRIWVHGLEHPEFGRLDREIEQHDGGRLNEAERRQPSIDDRALLIYTSGTTGLPKAANISHARVMQWSYWFAGLMNTQPSDRMYNCLPMYHSVGGVLATGAVLAGGGSVVIREKFSARQFWDEVVRWECTLFQYIGELCRYLLHTPPADAEAAHHIRLACGNGLRPDVWDAFKERFHIPQILEFYATTEGNVSLFNVEGKPGALGRVPPYLGGRVPVALVKLEADTGAPIRNVEGCCLRSAPNEVGEAIGLIPPNRSNVGSRFDGYSDPKASEEKILRHVFRRGDAWFRTGDLMRRDEQGYFYFVDRIGDTFRWKGENVATSEVAEALTAFPGVLQANVYGVLVPGTEGRAGMAALVLEGELDLPALRAHAIDRLPPYARPLFLRLRSELETTPTFKYTKNELVEQGYHPALTTDPIYFDWADRGAFVRLDRTLFDAIQAGEIRL